MLSTDAIILILMGVSGFVALVSGVWFFLEVAVFARARLNRSLNSTLDVIKVAKSRKPENYQDSEKKTQGEKEEISVMEQLFSTLANVQMRGGFLKKFIYGPPQITLEMAVPSDEEQISFYVSMPRKLKELVEKQIHSFYPSAHIERVEDYTIFRPGSHTVGSYLKLNKNAAFPIRTYQRLESDPLHNLTNAFSKLEDPEEGACLQVVFKKSSNNSVKSKGEKISREMQQGKRLDKAAGANKIADALSSLLDVFTKKDENSRDDAPVNLTPEENDIIKQIENKVNKSRLDANIRILASAKSQERAEAVLAQLENAFSQFEDSNLNNFKAIRDKSRNAHRLSYDYIFRHFKKSTKVTLDTEELASVFHLPISTTETPKLNWLRAKAAPPPVNIPKEGLLLGYSDFRGTKTDIRLSPDDRRRHLYIVGQTGTGKSGFIEELTKQDAVNKEGMCIIDPHGDLIDNVLANIPKERAEDVIFFDPSDTERPFGFNMLEYDENYPEQRTFVVNEIINIFDKLYDLSQTGGPMFEQYMRNALLLVMDSPETGSTLMEVPRVFRDPEFRKEKLKLCKDETVIDFWQKEAEKAGGDAALENIAPYINSKLTSFISNDMMRPIISQQESTINFRKAMDEGKILLVSLSKGRVGEVNSHLLGMIVVGKILMAAFSRTDIPEDQRKDFYLYIDEFQNFTTDSISTILSEARKYKLGLTIAHQFIGQLSENISKAVFGNVGSMCSFRVGSEDAEFLQKQFSPVFDADDLININNFQCFTKLLINNESTDPFNMKTYPPTEGNDEVKQALKEYSRYKYGRSRDIVESEIKGRYKKMMSSQKEEDLKKERGEKGEMRG
ncbi:MAG: type IV secretion system DNA-binding domain-containing protein [Candidatus Moranbacteria bacterium]|nr:type IV secretion system DNA-binding domain-containing protein [Candidatus Moranbacteria bacterium]